MVAPDPLVWNGFTRAGLDAAYNNTEAVAHSAATLADLTTRSASTRDRHGVALDLPYGPLPRQKIDLFACGKTEAPLFVFIHGGYWQRNSKDMFSAMAEGPIATGFDVALIGYTLAPDASLTEIIAECETAIRFLRQSPAIGAMGKNRIIVGGWSAGGHLAARMLELPEVDAAISISGIFDLEPIRHCYLQDKLRLSEAEARTESPIHRLDSTVKPMIVAFGLAELPELQRQSESYLAARAAHGCPAVWLALAERDHFSILGELARPAGAITQALSALR